MNDVDALRAAEERATDFTVLVEDPAPWGATGTGALLRVSGLSPDDIVWVGLDDDGATT